MILEIREKVLIKRGRVPSLNIKTKNKIILHKPFLNNTRTKYRLTLLTDHYRRTSF